MSKAKEEKVETIEARFKADEFNIHVQIESMSFNRWYGIAKTFDFDVEEKVRKSFVEAEKNCKSLATRKSYSSCKISKGEKPGELIIDNGVHKVEVKSQGIYDKFEQIKDYQLHPEKYKDDDVEDEEEDVDEEEEE